MTFAVQAPVDVDARHVHGCVFGMLDEGYERRDGMLDGLAGGEEIGEGRDGWRSGGYITGMWE